MAKVIEIPDVTATSTLTSPSAPSFSVPERLRHNNFDGLRLIFASMVLIFHVALLSQAQQLSNLTRYVSSAFAVQSFFFVSGFLVTMSYENTNSLVEYCKKRVFRIAPAYIFVVLAASILLVSMSELSPTNYFTNPQWRSYVISNLMLSNFNQPTLPSVFTKNFEPTVNGSLWTIKLEVMFYCTVPVIVYLIRRLGYRPILYALFFISIIWAAGFMYAGQHMNSDIATRLSKQLPGQFGFFAGGAFAYYRTRDGLSPPPTWMAAVGAVIYASTSGFILMIVAPFCVTVMIYWASIRIPQIWSAKRWGDFSYGLYLFHFPIAQVLIAIGFFTVAPIFGLIAVYALALLAAVVSWRLIEKPALQLAHRRSVARSGQLRI